MDEAEKKYSMKAVLAKSRFLPRGGGSSALERDVEELMGRALGGEDVRGVE